MKSECGSGNSKVYIGEIMTDDWVNHYDDLYGGKCDEERKSWMMRDVKVEESSGFINAKY